MTALRLALDGARRRAVGRGLGARERRTLALGALLVAATLFVAEVALPFVGRWRAREAVMAARTAELARLRALTRAERALGEAVRRHEGGASGAVGRPLLAFAALQAAEALQGWVQQAAVRAALQVERVDVAPAVAVRDGPREVGVTLVALGDVHGLAALLDALQHGATLAEVTMLQAQPTVGASGEELLHVTIEVHAPWVRP